MNITEILDRYFEDWYRYLARRVRAEEIKDIMRALLTLIRRIRLRRKEERLIIIYEVSYRYLKKKRKLGNEVALLARLLPLDQEILRLFYYEQLSLAEAALILQLTPEQLQKKKDLALNNLKQHLTTKKYE